ncbi:hypothetical protein [Solimonas marina]|uniref:Uncharacterized protein n=1 Tax=Solimonas marina TaxID=2714601 RepID=A0A969W8I2_9GAMM|nr:hypothetical protein [Solimonas marina]NKF21438.1 hypothetical protein [Solimonas marina]
MNLSDMLKKTLIAASIVAVFGLAGCEADGTGQDSGAIIGDDGSSGDGSDANGGLGPNDGSVPTVVNEDDDGDGVAETPVGEDGQGFVCKTGAAAYGTATTEVGSGGLVGGLLNTLLGVLGGDTLTTLLASVTEPDNVIDGDLSTYATFTQTLGGLVGLDSVDESVIFPDSVPAGTYAVFGLSFPAGTVDASLLNQITVSTYDGDASTPLETVDFTQNAVDLLGATVLGDKSIFLGIKTKKAFTRATVSLSTTLLSANVGDAMYVHELCTGGDFVTAPTDSGT